MLKNSNSKIFLDVNGLGAGQFSIRCLLCNVWKPYIGFLSHIRQEHLNYNRYQCTNCTFQCDNEEVSALHYFETEHIVEFSGSNFQEHAAIEIFYDCYREQFYDRCGTKNQNEIRGSDDLEHSIHGKEEPSSSVIRKTYEKVELKKRNKSDKTLSCCVDSKRKNAHIISNAQMGSQVTVNGAKKERKTLLQRKSVLGANAVVCIKDIINSSNCDLREGKFLEARKGKDDGEGSSVSINLSGEEKLECNVQSMEVSIEDSEPSCDDSGGKFGDLCKSSMEASSAAILSLTDALSSYSKKDGCLTNNNSVCVGGVGIPAYERTTGKQEDNPKVLKENSDQQWGVLVETTNCQKCGMEVAVHYTARKTHALQYHFARDDDPEIADLLPATIKACFPLFLSSSDNQCTECGKAFGTHDSRKNHVLKDHFCWSAICPLSSCAAIVTSVGDLKKHFMVEHGLKQSEIAKELKLKLRKMENEWKDGLCRRMNHCFPCALPQKKRFIHVGSTNDDKGLPKPSISSVLSSLLNPPTLIGTRKKVVNSSSSSDTESSSEYEGDDSQQKKKKSVIVEKEGSVATTGFSEMVDSSNLTTSYHFLGSKKRYNILHEKQFNCTSCHLKIVDKNLIEFHTRRHLMMRTGQVGNCGPFQCARCEFSAYLIPDILCHVQDKHDTLNGNLLVSKVSHPILQIFLKKVAECFPPNKQ